MKIKDSTYHAIMVSLSVFGGLSLLGVFRRNMKAFIQLTHKKREG